MASLLRDGHVLAPAEIAATARARRRGLIGRDRVDGAFVLEPCRQIHTFGMQMPIDVIWRDRGGCVLRITKVAPRRVTRVVWRARSVIEAAEGAARRWELAVGDRLEVRRDGVEDG